MKSKNREIKALFGSFYLPLYRRGLGGGFLAILFTIACQNSYSQEVTSENKWEEYIEELYEDAEENPESLEKLYNDLSFLSENPLNLNKTNVEQLRQIPFLSELQIINILDYQRKQGEIVSIYELKNIPFLDMGTIELILPFVFVGEMDKRRPVTLKNLLRYGINEFMARYDRGLNEKKGYKTVPDSVLEKYPNRQYVGEPFYTSLRYSYSFDNRIQMGVVAEKDAGEAFWNKKHKGYDYYSAHFFMKDLGKIKTLALGDYKMSFGQGLVMSNDFSPSRSSILTQVEKRNNGFRRHYSTNESDFFRGAATTITLRKIDVSAFYSYRKADATADESTISSFKTDGMHRTAGDLAKKHNISIQTLGGNIRYVNPNYHVGITAINYSFGGLSVEPELRPYNVFYFRGKSNTNISADYSFRHRQFTAFGETALSENGSFATLNALLWNVSTSFRSLILYRNFGRKYQAFYGNAFSQGSTVQNEEGLFLSLQWAPIAYWKFSGFADIYRFPWLKYGVDAPSSGKEYMIQTDYTGIKKTTVSARYRFKQREKNITQGHEVMVSPSDQHRLRVQIVHKPSKIMSFRTTIEGNMYEDILSSGSNGWLISQNASWKKENHPVQADLYAAYFKTSDYNTRVYSNEKNMLYSFSIPSFYGEGTRLTAVLRYNFSKRVYIQAKAAWTHYYDRDLIGSDLEEIEGRNKMDLYAQLRWKF